MNPKSVLQILFSSRFIVAYVFAAAISWSSYFSPYMFCILFTVYDIIGYEAVRDKLDLTLLHSYRIIQTAFQLALVLLAYACYGLFPALGFLLLWWFGLCDYLYYAIGRYETKGVIWDWLWWTPAGLCKIKITTAALQIQIIIAIWLYAIIMTLHLSGII